MNYSIVKDLQYYKFSFYGFFKNLRFFESFLILFFLEKGLTYVEIGFLYSIRELVVVATEIPSGVVADAMGRRKTLLSAFFVYILSFFTFYFSGSFAFFAMAMILFAFADAFRSGVHKAMIIQYLQVKGWSHQKAGYYGHTRSWSQRGSAVSSLIAAAIVFYSGNYQVIFLASVVPYIFDMILIWSYPKWLDGELRHFDALSIKQKYIEVEKGLVQTIKNFGFLKVLTSMTLYTGYYKAVKDYIQPVIKTLALSAPVLAYLNDEHKTAVIIGIFYFVVYLLTAWMSRSSGWFLQLFKDYRKPMNFTILLGFAAGIVSGTFFVLGWYSVSVLVFVAILLIENLRKPIGVAVVADFSNNHAMATVLSVASQVKSLFAAALAPVIGLVADKFGPGMGIAAVSVLLIVAYPVYRLKVIVNR